jgi:hypothetical protein
MAEARTKTKRQAKAKTSVTVVRQVTTAIQVGRDNYLMKATEDGRGVRLENEAGGVFIPFGEAGQAIVKNLSELVGSTTPRKRRRTKAEILAANAGQPKVEPTGGETEQ